MKEQRFYCIGIHKRCNVKEKDETELSRKLSSKGVTLVGEGAVWIFDNKSKAKEYLKRCKAEQTDKTVLYKLLDMGTEMPKINPSKLIAV